MPHNTFLLIWKCVNNFFQRLLLLRLYVFLNENKYLKSMLKFALISIVTRFPCTNKFLVSKKMDDCLNILEHKISMKIFTHTLRFEYKRKYTYLFVGQHFKGVFRLDFRCFDNSDISVGKIFKSVIIKFRIFT